MRELEFLYKDARVSADAVGKTAKQLEGYREHLRAVLESTDYSAPEASINLPFDKEILRQVNRMVNKFKSDNLQYVVVVGIGGSNLGAKAVYEGVFGQADVYDEDRKPKLLFADTVNQGIVSEICSIIESLDNPEEVVLNVITKSGSTTETIANFEVLFKSLRKRFGDDAERRLVFTTDEGSELWKKAEEDGIARLFIPKNVGGRFSVFSGVGLFPLALSGVRIDDLLAGARSMVVRSTKSIGDNPAIISAAITFLLKKDGISVNNNFFFNSEMESVGKWCRQLVGESIGKEYGKDGREIREGITPTVSIGSTDLHSMAQLYLGGPHDKFTQFVYAEDGDDIEVPEDLSFVGLVPNIAGKSFREITGAILNGTKEAYSKNKIPFTEVKLSKINEYAIGEFLQFKMFEVTYLAELLGVNAFDQPAVEKYKRETRELLAE